MLFLLRIFHLLALLKHCVEAIQLPEEFYKVLEQLPCTSFPRRT